MLHAPTSENKRQNPASRTALSLGRTPELSPPVPATMLPRWSGATPHHQVMGLHSRYGNQAVLRTLSRSTQAIQAKLAVNNPSDQFEQEADRVADQVMRMAAPVSVQRKCTACAEEEKLQRKCAECEEEEKKTELHRKEAGAGPQFAPPSVHQVLNSPGHPLDPATRAFMEPRFGFDFSQVRVHDDQRAAESAQAVGALAYTVGRNVVFGAEQYQPGSAPGRRLLAHELTHVAQQRSPSAAPTQPVRGAAIVRTLPPGFLARDEAKPTDTQLCASPFTAEEKIRCALTRKPEESDQAATATWKENVRDLFKGVTPPAKAQQIHERLTSKVDDAFTIYFKKQLNLADQTEMLTILAATFLPASSTPPKTLSSDSVGQNIATAAESFPPAIKFGLAMGQDLQGDGVLFNPDFWVVEYVLKTGTEEKKFTSSKSQPAILPQLREFLDNNPASKTGSRVTLIRVKIGGQGASAAMEDLWNAGSSQLYKFECFTAATLIQLRGFYLSYIGAAAQPSIGRAAFNRDFNSFVIERPYQEKPGSSIATRLAVNPLSRHYLITESDMYKAELKRGDQVPIQNPYLTPPWAIENSIYLGDDKFFGFPKGVFTAQEYIAWVADIAPRFVTGAAKKDLPDDLAERKEYVRTHSYLQTFSRPLQLSADLP